MTARRYAAWLLAAFLAPAVALWSAFLLVVWFPRIGKVFTGWAWRSLTEGQVAR